MRYSHSRVETFLKCPYQFKLRYLDELDTLPNFDDPTNALIIGTAMHHGIEQGAEEAVNEYYSFYPVITDKHVDEAMKIQNLVPKVMSLLSPDAIYELPLDKDEDFIGFVDYYDLKTKTLLDFKYSNNIDHYLESSQIHIYRKKLEDMGYEVNRMGYLFIPKIQIRQKKTETVQTFRNRMLDELSKAEPKISWVEFDESKIGGFYASIKEIESATDYPKNQTRLCDWCDYKAYCEKGENFMLLPKNEKRNVSRSNRKTMWIYGEPFSGKTTFASYFPNVVMLNTDGNYKYVDSPVLSLVDEKVMEGKIEKVKTFAWKTFKSVVDELTDKSGNTFETVVLDLVEDVYESCRLYMYDKLGIKHESDDPFKAWDIIRTEFLSEMRRFMNLPYNIILISHEDSSKDLTKRGGDKLTTIKPNINDKVANKLAGMVDIVIRAYVDNGNHTLSFKSDEVVFGGGRLKLDVKEVPNNYDAFISTVYKIDEDDKQMELDFSNKEETPVNAEENKKEEQVEETPVVEEKKEDAPVEEAPVRRTRRVRKTN